MPYRTLTVRQRAQIWVGGPEIGQPELLFESDTMLIEAPNWSLDGAFLFVNGHGRLWRLDVGSRERGLARVDFEGLPELNNDHVLDPNGEHIYMSAMDGHIYRGRLDGGPVDRVSPEDGIGTFCTESLRTDHALPMSKLANLPIPESSHCWPPGSTGRRRHRGRTSRRTGVVARRQLDLLQHRDFHR